LSASSLHGTAEPQKYDAFQCLTAPVCRRLGVYFTLSLVTNFCIGPRVRASHCSGETVRYFRLTACTLVLQGNQGTTLGMKIETNDDAKRPEVVRLELKSHDVFGMRCRDPLISKYTQRMAPATGSIAAHGYLFGCEGLASSNDRRTVDCRYLLA
jgi:hypothetical protein